MANEPSACERELLEMLAEEAGEVVQAVTKILRHGWDSYNPTLPAHKQISNRQHLGEEYLELSAVYDQLVRNRSVVNYVTEANIQVSWQKKLRYTHHQTEKGEEPQKPADYVNDITISYDGSVAINIIREQFEEWASSDKGGYLDLTRDGDGYAVHDLDARWDGWLAAERRKFDWPTKEQPAALTPPLSEEAVFEVWAKSQGLDTGLARFVKEQKADYWSDATRAARDGWMAALLHAAEVGEGK